METRSSTSRVKRAGHAPSNAREKVDISVPSSQNPSFVESLKERRTPASDSALSPICANALAAVTLVEATRRGSSRNRSKSSKMKSIAPKLERPAGGNFASEVDKIKNAEFGQKQDSDLQSLYDDTQESSADDDEASTDDKRTVVWSNAAFLPGSVLDEGSLNDDSNSSSDSATIKVRSQSKFPCSRSRECPAAATELRPRIQRMSKLRKEKHDVEDYSADMDLASSPAASSDASAKAESSPADKRFRKARKDSEKSAVNGQPTHESAPENDFYEEGVPHDACTQISGNMVTKKVLFGSREELTCRALDEEFGSSTAATTRTHSTLYCSQDQGKFSPDQKKVRDQSEQAKRTGIGVANTIVVEDKVAPNELEKPVALFAGSTQGIKDIQEVDIDSNIDEIEREIQRLTQKLAELQLQQAAKRSCQGKTATSSCEDKTQDKSNCPQMSISEAVSRQKIQKDEKTSTQVTQQGKPAKGTISLPQTSISEAHGKQSGRVASEVVEERKVPKNIGIQTPNAEVGFKQSKPESGKISPQVGEQSKAQKGRVVSARFLQWQPRTNNSKENKTPAKISPAQKPGNLWATPQMQRRCVSLGAATCPAKGKALQCNIADSPVFPLRSVNRTERKTTQVEQCRKTFNFGEERGTVCGGPGIGDSLSKECNNSRFRRLSYGSASGLSAWANNLRVGSGYEDSIQRQPKRDLPDMKSQQVRKHCRQLFGEAENKPSRSTFSPTLSRSRTPGRIQNEHNSTTPRTARFVASRYGQAATLETNQTRDSSLLLCGASARVERSCLFERTRDERGDQVQQPAAPDAIENGSLSSPAVKNLTIRRGYPGRCGINGSAKKSDMSGAIKHSTEQIEQKIVLSKEQNFRAGLIVKRNRGEVLQNTAGRAGVGSFVAASGPSLASLHDSLESLLRDSKEFFKKSTKVQALRPMQLSSISNSFHPDNGHKDSYKISNLAVEEEASCRAGVYKTISNLPPSLSGISYENNLALANGSRNSSSEDLRSLKKASTAPSPHQNNRCTSSTENALDTDLYPEFSATLDAVHSDSDGLEAVRQLLPKINTSRLIGMSPRDSGCVKRMKDRGSKQRLFGIEGCSQQDPLLHMEFEEVEENGYKK